MSIYDSDDTVGAGCTRARSGRIRETGRSIFGDYLMAVDGIRVNCIDEVMEALSNNTGLQVVCRLRRPASQPTSKGTKVSGMPSSSTPRGDLTSGKTPATQLHTSSSAANGRNRRSLRPRIKGSDKSTLPRISLPNGHASCTDSDDSLFEVDDSDYDGSSAGSDSDDLRVKALKKISAQVKMV